MSEDKRHKLRESNLNKLNPYKKTSEKFFPNGVRWDEKNDNPQIKSYIARIALLITTLAANIVKEVKSEPGVPQKPDPKRMMMICYSISCGHGFLNGRTSLTMDDLPVPVRLLDTIPESRYNLLQALVKNGGTITSKEYTNLYIVKNTSANDYRRIDLHGS